MNNKAVIVEAKRTPIGKVGGMLKDVSPEQLAAHVMKALISECGLSFGQVDEVILGNATGPGGNLARLALLTAGFPVEVPGVTVDRQCGSGLEAVNLAARLIQAGAGEFYVAGGVESTSQAPWKIEKPASLYKGAPRLFTRTRFSPVFRENGTVTAGNACPINDGAAVLLVMSERKARELGLVPVLEFVDAVSAGVDPNLLGIGPVPAVKKLLERQGMTVDEIDLVEFNEAFASQVIASLRELGIPWDKVNVGGGAIALGHPYGASGAILVTRLVTRLVTEMSLHQATWGLATLGIGGGLGLATLFKRYIQDTC
ncbi:acetyl-CoA acetyltransferase [Caldalkalibacillus uzonensis]|uniref:Acetyl-CoA acetyltransferase n=1 Tax=Caldalkalibacillus uzonensis TaxID=353224 RepID=A0ABU0CWA7_9BACI|nr:thiolase family protein [Caldalkalibacillus uzonensis]MDQ0339332.1 acetyl-CoA acetyltransferase [Caldalkalibacillus uzonensis]